MPIKPAPGSGVVALITRTVSRNQGNVALSRVWRDVLSRALPDHEIVPLERVHAHLKRYTLRQFLRHADPVEAFEATAQSIADRPLRPINIAAAIADISLDSSIDQADVLRRLRRSFDIRSRLARAGVYAEAFDQRQAVIAGASLVVMNAAGEFLPRLTDTPVQYLLDLRVAQLLGRKTAFVNTSFEVSDPVVKALALHVLDRTDYLAFRDQDSAENYRGAGGKQSPIVHADAAMLHGALTLPSATRVPTGRIALIMNGPATKSAGLIDRWFDLADALRAAGLTPVFSSNEWFNDAPIWSARARKGGFETAGQGKDAEAYAQFLGGFDAVVSGRLHSAVLAAINGTPIITVETGTWKVSGLFQQLGFAFPPAIPEQGWQDMLVTRLLHMIRTRAEVASVQHRHLATARADLDRELMQAFSSLAHPETCVSHSGNRARVA